MEQKFDYFGLKVSKLITFDWILVSRRQPASPALITNEFSHKNPCIFDICILCDISFSIFQIFTNPEGNDWLSKLMSVACGQYFTDNNTRLESAERMILSLLVAEFQNVEKTND